MNASTQIQHQLESFGKEHPEIACIYLFGSATGERFTAASDVDIGIAMNDPLLFTEKARLKEELEAMLQRDVDLIDLQNAAGPILRQALRGTCILCRNTHRRYELMRRLIYDQEDMQPLRDRIMQQRRLRFAYGT